MTDPAGDQPTYVDPVTGQQLFIDPATGQLAYTDPTSAPSPYSNPATSPYPAPDPSSNPAYPGYPGYPTYPASGAPASGYPASGVPASGAPGYGMPTSGTPGSGIPGSGMPASGSPYGGGYGAPAYSPAYAYPVNPRQTNGLATASMVLSIVGAATAFCYGIGAVAALVGAILGHVARRQIQRQDEGGAGFALAGIIIGWVVFGLTVLIGVALIIVFVVFNGSSD